MVMICEDWIMRIPSPLPVMTPIFCTARRTAGQNTDINNADLIPSFLIAHPVTKRFKTPKTVVEADKRETARAVPASIS
jgi:hypothetical protein